MLFLFRLLISENINVIFFVESFFFFIDFFIIYSYRIVWGHVLDENYTQEKKEEIPTTSHLGFIKIDFTPAGVKSILINKIVVDNLRLISYMPDKLVAILFY